MASLHMINNGEFVIFLDLPWFLQFWVYAMPSSHLIQHHILISRKWNFIRSEQNDDTNVLVGNINNVHHFIYFNVR